MSTRLTFVVICLVASCAHSTPPSLESNVNAEFQSHSEYRKGRDTVLAAGSAWISTYDLGYATGIAEATFQRRKREREWSHLGCVTAAIRVKRVGSTSATELCAPLFESLAAIGEAYREGPWYEGQRQGIRERRSEKSQNSDRIEQVFDLGYSMGFEHSDVGLDVAALADACFVGCQFANDGSTAACSRLIECTPSYVQLATGARGGTVVAQP